MELFFGISGIVIVGALQRACGPLVFAIERATRIYPVLWASVLVICALAGMTHYEGRGWPDAPTLTANLLALPPLVPGTLIHPAAWSLSYELLFYGFCAVVWQLRRRLGPWAFALAVPVAAALLFFHVRALLMPIGMGAAVLLAHRPRLARWAVAPGLGLLIFLVCWETLCRSHGAELMAIKLADIKGWDILLLLSASAAALFTFAGILAGRGLFSRALSTAPMQFLGTVSYSLYLWHPIVMSMVKHAMYATHLTTRLGASSQAGFLVLVIPPSLALAWLSQKTLERRVTPWLRRKLEPGRGHGRPPVTSAHTVPAVAQSAETP